jgi:hypothetical protein
LEEGEEKLDSGRQWMAVCAGVAFVTLAAIWRLRDFPYHLEWIEAIRAIAPVLPETAWAAARVWTFWAVSACAIAGLIRRYDSSIELGDAILAGAAGLMVLAYLLGNLIGPLPLMRSWVVWILLTAAIVPQLRGLLEIKFAPMTAGQKLALTAWALLSVSLIVLQLGSPVPPFMDVLNHPAAAQRIVTFHRYLAFDDDPYGVFSAHVQAPAVELFYAVLALGSGTKMATLAETAGMVPMAGLLLFTAYRLGRSLLGDTAGGMASLLLFFTCLLRREQGMRATAVVFVLIGMGLAFFLDQRRNRTLFALGALALGTSVAVHAVCGAFAMIVATAGVMFWIVSADWSRAVAGVICLAGATMLAIPELLIGTQHPVAYPILPLIQLAGIGVIVAGASRVERQSKAKLVIDPILGAAIVAALFGVLIYRHWFTGSIFDLVISNLPILCSLAAMGMVALGVLGLVGETAAWSAGVIAVALLIGSGAEIINNHLSMADLSLAQRDMLSNLVSKAADYWLPFVLIFPAGLVFALIHDRVSKPLAVFAVLAILIYPWTLIDSPQDYDSAEHAISEQWAFNLSRAESGYWAGADDGRWMIGRDGFALMAVLERELKTGRITPATHILHLTSDTFPWALEPVAIFTGVDDDPIDFRYDPNNQFQAGSRVRGPNDLRAALGRRPPYILEQCPAPAWMGDPPDGYDEIFESGNLRLYRLDTLTRVGGEWR